MQRSLLPAAVVFGLLQPFWNPPAIAGATLYPAPEGSKLSADYAVFVDGRPAAAYAATTHLRDGKYSFAYFDFSGSVTVSVRSALPLAKCRILPLCAGVAPRVRGDTLEFTLSRPVDLSIEPDGPNSPLLLFTNPPEEGAPKPGDPNVVYFGPGVHRAGVIRLASHQTLYLAGGSVVKGAIEARGEDITVCGRGILSGEDWPWNKGPAEYMAGFEGCRGVTMRDVVLQGSWYWTIVPQGCRSVSIDHVRICGSRVENDDGVDVCNCVDVTVRDCFIRTDDDCIAVKGLDRALPSEGLLVEGCRLWTDRANIFRIGFECEAAAGMRSITGRNLDVLHYPGRGLDDEYWSTWVWYIQPCDETAMDDMDFEDVRIDNRDGARNLVKIRPMIRTGWGWEGKHPGKHVRNVRFRNVSLTGASAEAAPGVIYVSGADAGHVVDKVVFENVVRYGIAVSRDAASVRVGDFATHVVFQAANGPLNPPGGP
jgi:hypothetical protein